MSSLAELEAGHPTIGSDILILLADRLAETVDFDVAGLLRQFLGMNEVAVVGMQGFQQRCREAARGAKARAGRDVGHGGQLEPLAVHLHVGHGLADDGVGQLGRIGHALELRIFDDEVFDEGLVQRDVDVAVDRSGDQEAAELAVIGRQVGAAASQGDAERASDDDHARSPR